tara:strand:+ start:1854 stop:5102 length:3249 start_codon:yes stop_codon:yes gene_type:complete
MSSKVIKKIKRKKIKHKKSSSSMEVVIANINNLLEITKKTILSVQKYKTLDIISSNNLYNATTKLENIFENLMILLSCNINKSNLEEISQKLNKIKDNLGNLMIHFGTEHLKDLIFIRFGKKYLHDINVDNNKLSLLLNYAHPISYKVLPWKNSNIKPKIIQKNRIVEDYMIIENSRTLECFDLARTSNNFQTKVYGIKISFQNKNLQSTMIVKCIIDDLNISCIIENKFISEKINNLYSKKPNDPIFGKEEFSRFINSLTLKQLLIYSYDELFQKYTGYTTQNKLLKSKTISNIIKDFINSELYKQRNMICQILIKFKDPEFQYLAYLLYDLLSNEVNGNIDTQEQTLLYDSFPWNIKKYFRDAMNNTIKYTKNLTNFDTNSIPIEQQICMLKAPDNVKEKAMIKLKEVKAKSEDSGSKARQYLDGLLKIPFGIFRNEYLLTSMKTVNNDFKDMVKYINTFDVSNIKIEDNISTIKIIKTCRDIKNNYIQTFNKTNIDNLIDVFINNKRDILISNICFINNCLKELDIKNKRLRHSGKKNGYMKTEIKKIINDLSDNKDFITKLNSKYIDKYHYIDNIKIEENIDNINSSWSKVNNSINGIADSLDTAIYGHKNAKRQIQRIIGQWITGKQTGYCFGFEGSPGVGKTSIARKGLANCLKDADGTPRPFHFIALGGASNGSTLSGHNYTYVGSTWGKIVDILIQSKCMNPIIFIDELDKISNTEHGKEIIGILTHLIDTTQNKSFQDKYFSGIDLDLSKVLFIFSYNDVSLIDRILLDRIHRIKFNNLSLFDKLTITKNFILPEIFDKMNIHNNIIFSDEIIKFIIETYTNESGVRKLKELLFEIISEINLNILQEQDINIKLPINITKDNIQLNYLKDKHEIIHKVIHDEPQIGIINGLWANSLGMGGIIPIECNLFPSNNFLDFKLTGMQGDVMKESMNVAKTLAWKLTSSATKNLLIKNNKKDGLHIHCPEGAIKKDGPSAGTAITVAIYSLLNNLKISNKIAITGEINLQGKVSAIGGLKLKILGGIKAGVDTFLFPVENEKDFIKFKNEYDDKTIFEGIEFKPVKNIKEVIDFIFFK